VAQHPAALPRPFKREAQRDGERLLVKTTCTECGEHRVGNSDVTLRWEAEHHCHDEEKSQPAADQS